MAWVGKDGAIYTNYAEMRKNDARYELLDKQNKLLEEQNKLLRGVDNYTQSTTYYNYQKNEDLSNETKPVILPLLSFASIIPIIIGIAIIITRVGGADATLRGMKLIIGGFVFPSIYWAKSKRSITSIFAMTFIVIGFIFTMMIK